MSELDKLLATQSKLSYNSYGKVHCEVTGRDIVADLEAVRAHLASDKYLRAARAATIDLAAYEPYVIQHSKFPSKLFCTITKLTLNKDPLEVEKHMNGKRYKALLKLWEAGNSRATDAEEEEEDDLLDSEEDEDAEQDGEEEEDDDDDSAGLLGDDGDADEPIDPAILAILEKNKKKTGAGSGTAAAPAASVKALVKPKSAGAGKGQPPKAKPPQPKAKSPQPKSKSPQPKSKVPQAAAAAPSPKPLKSSLKRPSPGPAAPSNTPKTSDKKKAKTQGKPQAQAQKKKITKL